MTLYSTSPSSYSILFAFISSLSFLIIIKIKVMLTVFFNTRGIVHHEYAPEGQTVTRVLSTSFPPTSWCGSAQKARSVDNENWPLHHDNTPAHSLHWIQTFLAKHWIPVFHQPPSSPDMAPCDFWLFLKMKNTLKGYRFESREEIMQNVTVEMNTIP